MSDKITVFESRASGGPLIVFDDLDEVMAWARGQLTRAEWVKVRVATMPRRDWDRLQDVEVEEKGSGEQSRTKGES